MRVPRAYAGTAEVGRAREAATEDDDLRVEREDEGGRAAESPAQHAVNDQAGAGAHAAEQVDDVVGVAGRALLVF
jgi:hypothetical protein